MTAQPGSGYRVVVLSFDPRDSLSDMRAAAEGLGLASNPSWIFGIAAPSDLRRIANATGFWFRWDPQNQQYDHPAVLIAIDHDRIVRILSGAPILGARFEEVVDELRGKFVASYPAQGTRVTLRCFQYKPDGSVQISWGFVLMLLPGLFAVSATVWIFRLRRY